MVHQLPAALCFTAGVVGPPPSRRPFRAGLMRHIGLSSEDRLDAPVLAGTVKVQDAVHVSVVGDPEGLLTVG